jgi:hypothetical protein
MKSLGMWKLPMVLAGFGTALLLSPACKAQEVNPDHFTDSGVQNVYEVASVKPVPAAVKAKPNAPASAARARQTNSPATLQPIAKRTPISATPSGAQAVADKRKPASPATKKQ